MSKEELNKKLLEWLAQEAHPLQMTAFLVHPEMGMADGYYGWWVRVRFPGDLSEDFIPAKETRRAKIFSECGWELKECAMTRCDRQRYKKLGSPCGKWMHHVPVRKKIPEELRREWINLSHPT